MEPAYPTHVTAKDLLTKVFDYQRIWSSAERKNALPAKARLAQIESLLIAFGLSNPTLGISASLEPNSREGKPTQPPLKSRSSVSHLEYFKKGQFLSAREEESNRELLDRIFTTVSALYPYLDEKDILRFQFQLTWLFTDLLNFRQKVYDLTYPHQGMLEGFVASLEYGFHLQDQLKAIILDNLAEIDNTLWLLVDPAKRELSKEDIGYPEHDLVRLDLDWRMEHLY
jgi:hypothetical protein